MPTEQISIPVAILLGLIQGLTEFIPISSTAHIRIVPAFFDMPDPGAAYSAVIQLGSLLALLVFFRKDLTDFTLATLHALQQEKRTFSHHALMPFYLMLSTIPVSVCGLLFKSYIKGPLRSLYVIAGSLIFFAFLLFLADRLSRRQRTIEQVGWWDALWIGVAQAFALIPGASRSGTTLTMGLALGLDRASSMRYSFLLSIPAIGLSGVYELIKDWHELGSRGLDSLAVGTLVSVVSSYVVIAGVLKYLKTHSTFAFVVYRILMGMLILVLLGRGSLVAF